MSKYSALWEYICDNDVRELSFGEIEKVLGFGIDHSFLRYKKELEEYGYKVKKISMKNQTVIFERNKPSINSVSEKITVKRLNHEQIQGALSLVRRVFERFEAPEYSKEGTEEFGRFLDNKSEIQKLSFYGAFCEKRLAGVLAMRKNHISLFFVDEEYHHRGIGKKLFETMKNDFDKKEFTVNSSPYAVEIYKRLGFECTDTEQVTNGIRYTPMRF